MNYPWSVNIVEVGPRDGLQSEARALDVASRVSFINQLAECGLRYIEVGSFVSEKWVPQMRDSGNVYSQLEQSDRFHYSCLTPNLKGLEQAIDYGVKEVAIFASASESFSQKNLNASISDSLNRYAQVAVTANQAEVLVRGYVSCIAGCPYEGDVPKEQVLRVTKALLEMGCYEVSLGDTIGVANAAQTQELLGYLSQHVPVGKLAVQMHDTYGQALSNILVALQMGVETVDTSVAGLGGCPYAKGASGNVATEDLVYMLEGLGIAHGVDLGKMRISS